MVGTSIWPPSAAVVSGIGMRQCRLRAVALEQAVRRDAHEDVQIARRAAAGARIALAGEPDPGAVLDAGRDRDRQGLFPMHAAAAAAQIAGIADHPAGAGAGRAGALDREEALLRAHPAGAATARADARRRALGAAGGVAGLAAHRRRHADLRLLARERLLERDRQIVAQIAAAAVGAAPAAAAHEIAEQVVEHVGEAAEIEAAATAPPPRPGSKAAWPN